MRRAHSALVSSALTLGVAALAALTALPRAAADLPAEPPSPAPTRPEVAPDASGWPAALPMVAAAEVAKLTDLAQCEGKRLGEDCAARDAWKKHLEAQTSDDGASPEGKTKRVALVKGCLSTLEHASALVREAAAECVADHAEHLAERRDAARAVLQQIAVDRSEDARTAELRALRALNPTEHGLAKQVVDVARGLLGKRAAARELEALVSALEPHYLGPELQPAPEAVAFAVELLGRREAVTEAIDVLEKVAEPSAEACTALLQIAETKRGAWAEAIEALGGRGRCAAARTRAVEVVIEAATRPGGPSRASGFGAGARAIARFVDGAELDADAKKRLREAIEAAAKAGATARELEELREAVGAK